MRKLGSFILAVLMLLGFSSWAFAQSSNLYVNAGGLGDALVFPYYNAQPHVLSYFRIINTSDKGIVGKIRIREGKCSNEILDYLVCLSPHDQYTFWIANPVDVSGVSGAAVVINADADTVTTPGGWTQVATRINALPNSADVSWTYEGYIEFFPILAVDGATFEAKVKTPQDCLSLAQGKIGQPEDVPNALMGEAYIFDANKQAVPTYAYKALAYANFALLPLKLLGGIAVDYPTYNQANGGIGAVNNALAKSMLYGTYSFNLSDTIQGTTDYVLSFITKYASIKFGADNWLSPGTTEGVCYDHPYCVNLNLSIYNDKEDSVSVSDFSPSPGNIQVCNEIAYIKMGDGTILPTDLLDGGSVWNNYLNAAKAKGFKMGWVSIGFTEATPVVGLELQSWYDGYLTHMLPMSYSVGETVNCIATIKGVCVTCDTDCTETFSGDIPSIVQCENAKQKAECK